MSPLPAAGAIDDVTVALREADTFTKLYIDGKFVSTAQTIDCICEHLQHPCSPARHSAPLFCTPRRQGNEGARSPRGRVRCYAATSSGIFINAASRANCRSAGSPHAHTTISRLRSARPLARSPTLMFSSQTRRQERSSTRRQRPAPRTCALPSTRRCAPTRALAGPTSLPRRAQSELRVHPLSRRRTPVASSAPRTHRSEESCASSGSAGPCVVSYCSLGSPLVLRSGYEWQGNLPPGRV
jgi:hypothetical protein